MRLFLVFSLLFPLSAHSSAKKQQELREKKQVEAPAAERGRRSETDEALSTVHAAGQERAAATKNPDLEPERRDEIIQADTEIIEQVEAAHPQSPAVKTAVAQEDFRVEDFKNGIARAEQAVTLAKAQGDAKALIPALLTSAVGYGYTGDYPSAYAAASEAFNLDPKGPYAKPAFAIVELTKGRPARDSNGLEGAPAGGAEVQKLDEVLDLASPLNDPRVRLAGQAALKHLKAIVFLNQAMADLKVNDPAKALGAARKAFDLDPSIPDIYMQRALALMALQKLPDAVTELGQAIKLWSARPRPGKSLAAAYNTRSLLGA